MPSAVVPRTNDRRRRSAVTGTARSTVGHDPSSEHAGPADFRRPRRNVTRVSVQRVAPARLDRIHGVDDDGEDVFSRRRFVGAATSERWLCGTKAHPCRGRQSSRGACPGIPFSRVKVRRSRAPRPPAASSCSGLGGACRRWSRAEKRAGAYGRAGAPRRRSALRHHAVTNGA